VTAPELGPHGSVFVLRYRIVLFLERAGPGRAWVRLVAVQEAFAEVSPELLHRTLDKMEEDGLVARAGTPPSVRLLRKF
jgi:hypothetical protein